MAVHDLFSKRQKRLRGEVPDVFVYDTIPEKLRVQLVQIIQAGIGSDRNTWLFDEIDETLCREYGVFDLIDSRASSWKNISTYLLKANEVEHVIDIVELCLTKVDTVIRKSNWRGDNRANPDETISEVNHRFREHGVGYEYISGEMIRVDSQLIHAEVVKPVLKLLADPKFQGPNDEFLKAHDHYRHGDHKGCLGECLKAFESTMKTICDLKGWQFQRGANAKQLITICQENGLFPPLLQSQVTHLVGLLEGGILALRNNVAAHGQGPDVTTVPESIARFALHITAANIVLFIESAKI